ncbi:MAG: hypothetical protein BWK78_09965 [Thiotrichaceae bacterium IS1]|nr:MAG: hypothetical protein BWK78_09965 [Thiotrichaceae bacterium IS1]
MLITANVSDELAMQLRPFEKQLPRLLDYGLREFNATTQVGFRGMNEVLELFAKLPTPEEILALRPSETLRTEIERLLEKSRTEGLTSEEEQQWQQYEYLEHLVRLAKTHAILKLNRS